MTPTVVLLNIVGGVCLLLYGLRQIRRGIMRAFGANLRSFVAACTRTRLTGFLAGVFATLVLQSSAAVTMITATFVGQKMLTTAAALAVVLGADVGTTLVAQILTFDLSWLGPLLILIGFVGFSLLENRPGFRSIALAIFGLGLMLFALGWIKLATVPLKTSEALPYLLKPLDIDPVFTLIVGALLTWLLHSSLGFVMLVVAFVVGGIVTPHLALLLVLGANIGGVLVPLFATLRDEPSAVRLPFANLMMRLVLVVGVLPFLKDIHGGLNLIDPDPARQVVHFHMAFNLLLAFVFLPWVGVVSRVVQKLVPDRLHANPNTEPMYLDEKQMETPTVALSSAARETLRIADMVQVMLQKAMETFHTNNAALARAVHDMDTDVDHLNRSIKHYMTVAMRLSLDTAEAQRYQQILHFATSLEQIGDTIDKSIVPMAEEMIDDQKKFSPQGIKEIDELFVMVIDSLRLAQTVFMSSDIDLARRLVEGKQQIKNAERRAARNHFTRLREGVKEALGTSAIHLDLIRDLQRINTDVVTVAYPILEETGELLESRLTTPRPTSLEPDVMI